eukprot:s4970_g10.t1
MCQCFFGVWEFAHATRCLTIFWTFSGNDDNGSFKTLLDSWRACAVCFCGTGADVQTGWSTHWHWKKVRGRRKCGGQVLLANARESHGCAAWYMAAHLLWVCLRAVLLLWLLPASDACWPALRIVGLWTLVYRCCRHRWMGDLLSSGTRTTAGDPWNWDLHLVAGQLEVPTFFAAHHITAEWPLSVFSALLCRSRPELNKCLLALSAPRDSCLLMRSEACFMHFGGV